MNDGYDTGGSATALARVSNNSGALSATESAMGDRSLAKTSAHTHALAAQQEAKIKAQYTMALARPRDIDDARLKLVKRCRATRFAEGSRYKKPQGQKQDANGKWVQNYVEGWSIRFVEEAIRSLGNIRVETNVTSDDSERRMIAVSVIDMESNIPYTAEITINKTVERKQLKKNQMPLLVRTNSYGAPVYILPATDDEVRMSEARLISMTVRTLGLRLVPGDILDECLEVVQATQKSDVDSDPAAARKRLVDAFDGIGVRPVDIVEYLGGRPLDALTPDLILELRGVFQLMREEHVRWMDILGSSPYVERDDGDEPKKDGAAAKLREKIETKAEANAEKDKIAADRRAAVRSIAEAVGYDMKAVQTVLQQVNAGKDAANIARYSREQTGIEDEIVVNEIISRATTAGLLKTKQEPKLEDKAPETPKTAPAVPPAAETKLEANKGKRGAPSNTKFAAIAQQEGVSVEIVAEIAKYAAGEDPDATVAGLLNHAGFKVDEPTVGIVRAALRK